MTKLTPSRKPGVRVVHLPGDVAIVSLLGEHDLATASEVRNALTFAVAQGTHLVVDLSGAEFIDSSIIHALLESVELAAVEGRRVSLQVQTDASVRRVLEITGVLEALPARATRREAIAAVRQMRERTGERLLIGMG
ncbi:MAG: STAS domain-containing protein [Gaiellaceae bacterium]